MSPNNLPIVMSDTINQYKNLKNEIDKSVIDIISSGQYINGEVVEKFCCELARFHNIDFCIPCANGTDALQIALMALDIKPGDEVIVPSFTFIATAEVLALLGIKPVFIDINYQNFCLNVQQIKKLITPKTKAIIPVHLFGQAADLTTLLEIAKEHNLKIIEDNAQSIGCEIFLNNSEKKFTGTIGDIGTTSFYPSKNLGCCGDGGAITTQNPELAKRIKQICNHGQSAKYIHNIVGVNSRLDSIQAAILLVKLNQLNSYIKSRQEVAHFYNENLASIKEIILPQKNSYSTHVYNQYSILIKDGAKLRHEFIQFLHEHKIPSMIYYPIPAHKQEMFNKIEYTVGDLDFTEQVSNQILSLPIHTEMNKENLEYICYTIKKFFI